MKLKNEDIEIYDSSMGFNTGIAFTLSVYSKNKEELEQLKQEILENQKIVNKLKELDIIDIIESKNEIDDYSVDEFKTREKWKEYLQSILKEDKK